jgi:hypothetical protein
MVKLCQFLRPLTMAHSGAMVGGHVHQKWKKGRRRERGSSGRRKQFFLVPKAEVVKAEREHMARLKRMKS